MKSVTIVTIAALLIGSSCGTSRVPAECTFGADRRGATLSILSGRWSAMTPDVVAELWPVPITWGSEAAGAQPCSGTATFSYLDNVRANDCRCCDTFGFTDVSRSGRCDRILSSVTLVREFVTELQAREFARQLVVIAGGGVRPLEQPVTTILNDVSGDPQTANIELLPDDHGWRVRVLVYRTTTESRGRARSSNFSRME